MGARGPLPKPEHLRQRRNRPAAPVSLVAVRSSRPPAAPVGMLQAQRSSWQAFWRSPLALAVDEAADLPALRRLWQIRDRRDRYERALRKQPIVAGSQGQPRANPLHQEIARLDAEIRQLEEKFGLTPAARARLGIQLGQARKTLEELNRQIVDASEEEDEGEDPRATLVEPG